MYSPYLKGKQNEFLALRYLSTELPAGQKGNVLPIIEPVKKNGRDAMNAFSVMMDNNWPFALVLNPKVGEYERGANDYYEVVKENLECCRDKWIPAFILDSKDDVMERITHYGFESVMVILPKLADVESWLDLIADSRIKYVVNCDADSMPVLRKLKRVGGKIIIRMDESFVAEQKNAAYASNTDHRFTDKHTYYDEFGYAGFGDYTTLPAAFISGGVSPTVVAIHLTYKKNEDEIWIHHFLSNPEARSNENVQGKFLEAASQIEPFFDAWPEEKSVAVDSLIDFVKSEHYPGLGAIKKWSVIHHIILMSKY